ncbi:hypothetical protein U8335_27475 [Roseiconus lacunae]|uniref:HEAT repeat domain-containing protein n=1 Tax=Roseiconus lacunae TaxID=2605694 RepID=UPI00309294EF|nr:hypothetical protein U8335_27475 [Stieleria sp. HD01]
MATYTPRLNRIMGKRIRPVLESNWRFIVLSAIGLMAGAFNVDAQETSTDGSDNVSVADGRTEERTDKGPDQILDVDYVMYEAPKFVSPPGLIEVSPEPLKLWLQALQRPDAQLQRTVIDTIGIAKQRGMPDLDQALLAIVELTEDKSLPLSVRRSAIKTVIRFNDKSLIPFLVRQATDYGAPVRSLVEPALVQWKDDSFRDTWANRLNDATAREVDLRTAIEGLAAIGDIQSSDDIKAIAKDSLRRVTVRLCAARALGELHREGLVGDASDLASSTTSRLDPLLAVALLSRHEDDEAKKLLQELAETEDGFVKAAALRRLLAVDPKIVKTVARDAVHHSDYAVRDASADILHAEGERADVAPLAHLLSDANPTLRRKAASMLYRFAKENSLADEVISQTMGVLDRDDWRGCEQATRVLVSLNYRPAGDRLVDLIRHPRGETMIAAGWGLRRLGDRQHLGAMLGRAQEIFDRFRSNEYNADMPGPHYLLAQLFLAFGEMNYGEAENLMRQYVPRNLTLGERARGAACWSLGIIHEGETVDELVDMMIERLTDTEALIPEYHDVRHMCAISLGRMNAEKALPALRKYATMRGDGVGRACFWSIEKLTGEELPPLPPSPVFDYEDWFIQPIKEKPEE